MGAVNLILGPLLLIALFVLLIRSPRKLRTLGVMGAGFVGTVLLITVPLAALRRGNPQALGQIAGILAMIAAVVAGWWHAGWRRPFRSAR